MPFKDRISTNIIYRLAAMVIILFITILISRIAGPEPFGILSLFILNATFLNLATSFGSESSITFYRATGSIATPKLLRFIYTLIIAQIIVSLICVLFFSFIGKGDVLVGISGLKYFLLWSTYVLSISIIEKYGALMNGAQLFTLFSRITLATNGLFLCLLLVLLILKIKTSTFSIISIHVTFTFIQAVAMLFAYPGFSNISSASLTLREFKTLIGYSVLIFFGNIVQFLAYRAGLWMIDWYRSDAELGQFALAGKISQMIWLLPAVYATLLFPKVSRDNLRFDHKQMLFFIRVMNIINIILIVLALVFLDWLVVFIAGTGYTGSISSILILLPGTCLFCITTVLAAYFAGCGKLRINLYGSALCLLFVLIFNFVFVPGWGIKGAALASTIGYSLVTVYFIVVYMQDSGTKLAQILIPGKEDIQYLLKTLGLSFIRQRLNKDYLKRTKT